MAQQTYPDVVALEAFEDGDAVAIHQQLEQVAEHHAPRTREFAFDAATAVARRVCEHQEHPVALPGGLSSKERKAAASAHPGLCGVSLAAVIAGICFYDVSATAERRGVQPTYNVMRNQVRVSLKFVCFSLPAAICVLGDLKALCSRDRVR